MNDKKRGQDTWPRHWGILVAIVLAATLLAACSGPSNPATSQPTAVATGTTPAGSTSTATTATSTPTSQPPAVTTASATTSAGTSTTTATASATAQTSATATSGSSGTPAAYLDDRSSAESLLESYYNAVNAKQYARAYSYWEPGVDTSQLPPFSQFQQGYATTQTVALTIGQIGIGAAAGNLYFSVPVALRSQTSDKGMLTFVGCYVLHLGQPANQAVPPFQPMAIQSATVKQVDNNADVQSMFPNACNGQPGSGPVATATPAPDPNDVSAKVYIDNRSDGEAVVRSYYNAINRKEYARAYAYWESNVDPSILPPFAQFQQGYAQTQSVTLTFGQVTIDAGAGQRYASVPTTIVATMTDGSQQTFVGCYVTHLASPDIQTAPPFHPMVIMRANVSKVASGADTSSLMASVCQQ